MASEVQVRVKGGGGIGFLGLLGLLFIALKLLGVINWPWLWVTAPLWGGLAFGLTLAVVMFAVAAVVTLLGRK